MWYCLFLFVIICNGSANDFESYQHYRHNGLIEDVCILGSGASGMSSAVFLKDKGYKVKVFEKASTIGGHCNTHYFTPPIAGAPNWVDEGVILFENTTFLNEAGFGSWIVDSVKFVQRFAGPNSIIPLSFSGQTSVAYGADLLHNISLGVLPNLPPTPEYIAAFGRLYAIVTNYSWLDNATFPDPIPAELLIPFDEFIILHQLQPLYPMFIQFINTGGMGSYNLLTTLYALQNVNRPILSLATNTGTGFVVNEGCASIYAGIRNYLGIENVIVNATTVTAIRFDNRLNLPILLFMKINASELKIYQCKNLFVSFPQQTKDLTFLDLTDAESAVFNNVVTREYYDFRVNLTGSVTTNPAFSIVNIDVTNPPTLFPFYPCVLAIQRNLPYGTSNGYSFSDYPVTDTQMVNIINTQLQGLNPLLGTATLLHYNHHVFQAHFNASFLSQSPSPYTKLDHLQGSLNTYYTGALFGFADSVLCWEKSKVLIDKYF